MISLMLSTQMVEDGNGEYSKNDGFARWYVSATSPMMHGGSYEYGDTYCREIKDNGLVKLILADDTWLEEYGT